MEPGKKLKDTGMTGHTGRKHGILAKELDKTFNKRETGHPMGPAQPSPKMEDKGPTRGS